MGAIYDLSAMESKCDFPLAKGSTPRSNLHRHDFRELKIFSRKKSQEDAKGRGGSSWVILLLRLYFAFLRLI